VPARATARRPRAPARKNEITVKRILPCSLALLWATTALADGVDQSGQPVTLLFRPGTYAELGYTSWDPTLVGHDGSGTRSGNVFGTYAFANAGFKTDLGEHWSAALIFDQPWAVHVDYPGGGFAYAGTNARTDTVELTGLLRYRLDDNWSLHGGLRAATFGADVALDGPAFGNLGYKWKADHDWGYGYVAGGAYEIPAMALRVALTYSSEVDYTLSSTETVPGLGRQSSKTDVTMPQSVNLDFQTGLNQKTMLFGAVRWVDWSGWTIAPAMLKQLSGSPLVADDSDTFLYKLGLGRQLTDRFAGAIEISHLSRENSVQGALQPFDGYTSLGLGGTYSFAGGVAVTAGAAYYWLGDAHVSENGARSRFDGNSALALNLNLGVTF